MKELFDLTGKTALVTGGTHGIGLAIGIVLAKAGAKVCVNDIQDEKIEACKEAYAKENLEVYTLKFNVTREDEV
ncbi:MAG: SDR family NAD(P)-dependent oxidoreductase, partial [Bacteroidales bacterium]|nr:SDR family NAD(P)-dependent oxidoreductase [Bacteroidales bacterium]